MELISVSDLLIIYSFSVLVPLRASKLSEHPRSTYILFVLVYDTSRPQMTGARNDSIRQNIVVFASGVYRQ
jgi:hypothetical protein